MIHTTQFVDALTIPPSDRRILRVRCSEWRDVHAVAARGPCHPAGYLAALWMVYWAHLLRQLHWSFDVDGGDAVFSSVLSFGRNIFRPRRSDS